MKRSSRLDNLAGINRHFENQAGSSFADAQVQLQKQEHQLQLLINYRNEYNQQLTEKMKTTSSAFEIREFQQFIATIDAAISQQQEQVQKFVAELQNREQEWLQKRHEVKKLSRAAEVVRQREATIDQRAERKEEDELGAKVTS